MTVIFSKTEELHGAGSAPYKWVSRLTRREREDVRQGNLGVIRSRQKRRQHEGYPPYRKVVTPAQIKRAFVERSWLSPGHAITTCQPGVSSHVSEWSTLAGRIDNCPQPWCADVDVSSWTVGKSVAGSIKEAAQESNQENT